MNEEDVAGGLSEVLLTAEPQQAMADLHGKVWEHDVPKGGLADFEARYQVISTHLAAGRTVVHVFSEQDPGEGFQPVEADLKDVYFTALSARKQEAVGV